MHGSAFYRIGREPGACCPPTARVRPELRTSHSRSGAWPAKGEVALPVVSVVPDVQRAAVGDGADGAVGLAVVGDVHPQRVAAVAGVTVVQAEGLLVVGEGGDYT